jgi:hypothetical protein
MSEFVFSQEYFTEMNPSEATMDDPMEITNE